MCSLDYLATAHLDDDPVIMTSGMSGRSASGATSMTGASICGADWPYA
jgi:thiamine pyrophosphate-dependent acetolactate synthase large subunit-like protein